MNLLYFTTKQLHSKKRCLCSELNANALFTAQYKLQIANYLCKLACKTADVIAKIAQCLKGN